MATERQADNRQLECKSISTHQRVWPKVTMFFWFIHLKKESKKKRDSRRGHESNGAKEKEVVSVRQRHTRVSGTSHFLGNLSRLLLTFFGFGRCIFSMRGFLWQVPSFGRWKRRYRRTVVQNNQESRPKYLATCSSTPPVVHSSSH